jgi:heat shock protein HslJ
VIVGALLSGMLLLAGCATDPASVVGRWGSPVGEDRPFVEFAVGGDMRGYDGCNGFSGRWHEPQTGSAEIEERNMTLIACEGVAGQRLNGIATAEVVGGRLIVSDSEGDVLGSLPRP